MDKDKPSIGLLIGVGAKPKKDDLKSESRESAARAFLDAIKDDDTKGLLEAFDLLSDDDDKPTDEPTEDSED